MVILLWSSCAVEGPTEPVAILEPLSPTPASTVEVPAAPAGCINSVRVRVPFERCAGVSTEPLDPEIDWESAQGALSGVEGECLLMCSPGEAEAQWLFKIAASGWVGDASCTVAGPGSMHIRATVYTDGDPVDPAVGALWLVEGTDHYGIARMQLPDGTEDLGVTTNGCAAGQPTRPTR